MKSGSVFVRQRLCGIYGKKKGNWTHEEVAQGFRDWMWWDKGYMTFAPGGENEDWVWSPCWECGNDF